MTGITFVRVRSEDEILRYRDGNHIGVHLSAAILDGGDQI